MKTTLHLLTFLFFMSTISFAQTTFTEDFESYQVGDYIAESSPDWVTWDGTTASATDVLIVDDNAASGNNAIYLASTSATGGPQDIVLPFGEAYETGQFELSMNLYIPETSEGAYFNLQGEEVIGENWALDVYFEEDNRLTFSAFGFGQEIIYPKDSWFEFAIKINLTANSWQIYLDGDCLGEYQNFNAVAPMSVASLNLYPRENEQFWIDDVSFSYDPMLYPDITDIRTLAVFATDFRLFTGESMTIVGRITNLGTTTINSFDATLTNTNTEVNQSFSGLNLLAGENYDFTFDEPYVALEGFNALTLTTTNINGMGDDADPCNNTKTSAVATGYTPAPGKQVLFETPTGTWCGNCPRGLTFMDEMTSRYPDLFYPAAAHFANPNDPNFVEPMEEPTHAMGLNDNGLFFSSNRRAYNFPFDFLFFDQITVPTVVSLVNGADFDETTNILSISVEATFTGDLTGDNRMNVILTEDGVTGTTPNYAQVNDFSGGTEEVGGFENLPNPVPADQMVYNHVSRGILGGFAGEVGSLPNEITAGETHLINFSIEVPADWNMDNMNILGFVLTDDENGNQIIDNSTKTTVAEAMDNGFQMVTDVENLIANSAVRAFPNPFGDELNVSVDLAESAEMTANLYSSTGALLRSQKVGSGQANHYFSIKTADLPNGVYQLNIVVGTQVIVKKVVLMR